MLSGKSDIGRRPSTSSSAAAYKPSSKKLDRSFTPRSFNEYKNHLFKSTSSQLSDISSSLSNDKVEVSDKKKSSDVKGINNRLVEWLSNKKVDPRLQNQFDTTKLGLDASVEDLHQRMAIGRQKEQDDDHFFQHKVNTQTFNEISLIIEGELKRIHSSLPTNLAILARPRSEFNDDDDVVYVCGDNNNGKPKVGDTRGIGEREKKLKLAFSHIGIIGTSDELGSCGLVSENAVDRIYSLLIIGRGFDDGSNVEHLVRKKIIRQVVEALLTVSYRCREGNIAEWINLIPSSNCRALTDGLMMIETLSGDVGKQLVDIISEYVPNLDSVFTQDTWEKADDYLREDSKMSAVIHSKFTDEHGNSGLGVTPYLDRQLHDHSKYIGFEGFNECPYIGKVNGVCSQIKEIMARDDDEDSTKASEIIQLMQSDEDLKDAYLSPTTRKYGKEAIKKLESYSPESTPNPKSTLFNCRRANFDRIQGIDTDETIDEDILLWGETHLKTVLTIPGSELVSEGTTIIKARDTRLVTYEKDGVTYLFFVRGSTFCLFDTKQSLDSALRFCLETMDEAVIKFRLGLLSEERLLRMSTMMQSYALLIMGPSASVRSPSGSVFDPCHYILPKGVFGALEGGAGNKISGAQTIIDIFDSAVHYYGVVRLLQKMGKKQFNNLLVTMGSNLRVEELNEEVYIFTDDGLYFYRQYDVIFGDDRVKNAFAELTKLDGSMVEYLLGNVALDEISDKVDRMIKVLHAFVTALFGDSDKTNDKAKSMKQRHNKMIEFLLEKERHDLVEMSYGLPHHNTCASSTLQWFASFVKLVEYKNNDTGGNAKNGAWVIISSDCNDSGVYDWWRGQAGLVHNLQPAVGIGKRLLEAKGITVDKAKVEEGLLQLQQKRIDDEADPEDEENMQMARKYNFF